MERVIKYYYALTTGEKWTGSFDSIEAAHKWFSTHGKQWEREGRKLKLMSFKCSPNYNI